MVVAVRVPRGLEVQRSARLGACASLLLVALAATILNVALPSLIDDRQPDAYQQLWIIDIHGLVSGGLLITAGAAGVLAEPALTI